MKKKLIKIYVMGFSLFVFFASAICAYDLINRINLPEGIISNVVNYGYLIVHIFSFGAMFHYSDTIFKSENEK